VPDGGVKPETIGFAGTTGVAEFDAVEAKLVPAEFVAVTVKV
jgi:hypothetical protein